jgi:hypothetical protein
LYQAHTGNRDALSLTVKTLDQTMRKGPGLRLSESPPEGSAADITKPENALSTVGSDVKYSFDKSATFRPPRDRASSHISGPASEPSPLAHKVKGVEREDGSTRSAEPFSTMDDRLERYVDRVVETRRRYKYAQEQHTAAVRSLKEYLNRNCKFPIPDANAHR